MTLPRPSGPGGHAGLQDTPVHVTNDNETREVFHERAFVYHIANV